MRDEARTPSVSCGIDCRTNLSFQSRPKLCPLSILSLHTPLKFFFISSFLLFFGWQMLLFLNLNRTNNIFPKNLTPWRDSFAMVYLYPLSIQHFCLDKTFSNKNYRELAQTCTEYLLDTLLRHP
jgi:hypothetical protein